MPASPTDQAKSSTVQSFFHHQLPSLLADSTLRLTGVAHFDIDGPSGGSWYVDFATHTVATARPDGALSLIVRAEASDFLACLQGRMSVADGVLSERLHISGDAAVIAVWTALMASMSQVPAQTERRSTLSNIWSVHAENNGQPEICAWAASEAEAKAKLQQLEADNHDQTRYWLVQLTERQVEDFKDMGFIP